MDIVFFLFLFFKSNKFWSNIYITLNVNSDVRIFFFFFAADPVVLMSSLSHIPQMTEEKPIELHLSLLCVSSEQDKERTLVKET